MSNQTHGRELHREFVGMLFALAIAEVAVQAASIANSGIPLKTCLPSYAHLVLATAVIATSWVGWGWSKHSLSNVENVFTFDFAELLLDLWLVVLYFFIVKGVELPQQDPDQLSIIKPSVTNESFWIFVIFVTYFVWDCATKIREEDRTIREQPIKKGKKTGMPRGWLKRNEQGRLVFVQRAWASFACAVLAGVAYYFLRPKSLGTAGIVVADLALISLVFLFRAMKLRDLFELRGSTILLILVFAVLFFGFLSTASLIDNSFNSSSPPT